MRRQRMQNKEARNWEYKNHTMQNDLWNLFGIFMKLLEVKTHYHEIEVCRMWSQFRRIMN